MITQGKFKDGTTGWKAVAYGEHDKVGFSTHEIHWSDDGECVAEIVHGEDDAKLIAAAPDLLEALQMVVGSMSLERIERFDILEKCNAAIEKAAKN